MTSSCVCIYKVSDNIARCNGCFLRGIVITVKALFCRNGFVALGKQTSLAKLSNGSVLTLVLRSLCGHSQLPLGPLGVEYGAKTYISLVEQSDCGTSKFFAILKFIVSCLLCHAHLKRLCY